MQQFLKVPPRLNAQRLPSRKKELTPTNKLSFIFQLLYGSGITAIKLSILLFYLRLFPKETTSRRWRASLYTIAAVLIFYLTAGAPVTIFQCRPIAYAWIRKGKGSCNDQLAFLYFSQAYMIATDIIILCLPIPVVWRLQLRKGKKIGVLAIFLLGSL